MATNIPPHNLGEVLAACRAFMDDPAISSEGLMEHVKGPDFPTGGLILGQSGIRSAYTTGRGSILMRSRHHVEEGRGDRRSIVLTEIPYQVGKNGLVEKIAEAAKDKRIEGVSDIRDESNREGVRIVIDLKRDATPDVVLNQLWRHTPAQIELPGEHARDPRRPARNADAARLHRGVHPLPRGSDHPPLEVRAAEGPRARPYPARPRRRGHQPRRGGEADPRLGEPGRGAREAARARMADASRSAPTSRWSKRSSRKKAARSTSSREAQVKAILELRLHRLTALGRDEIGNELEGLAKSIGELLEILANRARLYEVMREEFDEVEAEFATPRMTELAPAADGIEDEDLIEREDMVVTVTMGGYIKRTPLVGLPRAEARRQGPRRNGDQGRGCGHRRCSSPRRTIRCCSSRTSAGSTG